ncbi:MAG: hypothetical protein WCO25_04300 [Candidatus Uhrbacteria bacterium]
MNIPLHRYQQTTRLSRRVVSLFAVATTVGLLVLMAAATVWYGRDTTSSSAPQDTAVVLHFAPNRLTWDATKRVLAHIPLISNRPLTADDIEPYAHGEFSIFIASDGSRSVAIRATKGELPTKTLDALGIIVQDSAPGIVLLSDRPMARMAWKPKHVWFGSIHFPWNAHIGSLYVPDDAALSGSIYASKAGMDVRLAKQRLSTISWKVVPDGTIAALSTPALPNTDVNGVTSAIDTILSSYAASTATIVASHILSNQGAIVLTKNAGKFDYLFVTTAKDFANSDQQKFIQTAAALQIPRIQALTLPDNTIAKEMIVDPSLTTIEETTVAGTIVSRASSRDGGYLFAAEQSETVSITNSQNLLDFSLSAKKTGAKLPCSSNASFMDIRSVLELSKGSVHARTAALLSILANTYGTIGIEEGVARTTIHLCY